MKEQTPSSEHSEVAAVVSKAAFAQSYVESFEASYEQEAHVETPALSTLQKLDLHSSEYVQV